MNASSSKSINLILFILALIGCFISVFLTIKYAQHEEIQCTKGFSDCNAVANDDAAWGLGIPALKAVPTPALGILMYVTLVGLCLSRVISSAESVQRKAGVLQWSVAFVGLLVSGYLTWREAAVIHHWCTWCLGSAAIVLLIFLLSSAERFGAKPPAGTRGLEPT
jgi:uncharacterized membrane protein